MFFFFFFRVKNLCTLQHSSSEMRSLKICKMTVGITYVFKENIFESNNILSVNSKILLRQTSLCLFLSPLS